MSSRFPLFVDLSERKIIIVGGGQIAARRAESLLPFCGKLKILSPEINDRMRELISEAKTAPEDRAHEAAEVVWIREPYSREKILDADMVLACTNDPNVNNDIYAACKCLGILVNNCSDKSQCDFYFPGIVRKGNFVIGVTASGKDHARAKDIRKKIEEIL